MATDLPDPVVPATSRCGMRARSTMTGSPPIVLPSAMASLCLVVSKSALASSSRRKTVSRRWLGNSMPMALRPWTTATRAETADIERAMSSASPMTREDLIPGAGSSSYMVTTGPGRTLMISPLTPKSSSTPSSSRAFCDERVLRDARCRLLLGLRQQQNGGQFVDLATERSRSEGCASFLARSPGFTGAGGGPTIPRGASAGSGAPDSAFGALAPFRAAARAARGA